MKFSLSWLKDHLETDASAEAIAEKLTAIGLEVEEVSNPAAALAPFKGRPIAIISDVTLEYMPAPAPPVRRR